MASSQTWKVSFKRHIRSALDMIGLADAGAYVWHSLTPSGRRFLRDTRIHDQGMRQLYGNFVKAGDLCFDVGANYGTRVAVFLKLGARVVAIEPQQDCQKALQAKYRNNRAFILVGMGLDKEPGEHQFQLSSKSTIASMSPDWIEHIQATRKK